MINAQRLLTATAWIRIVYVVCFGGVALFASAAFSHAEVATTPYWCGSYYPSTPCNYGGNYNYNYDYGYNYPSYPSYNYYPPAYYYYPNYGYTYPAPSCTLTITTPSHGYGYGYGYGDQPATLSWYSSNATSAYISPNVGTVSTYGSTTVYPYGNATYTMTVSGPGGTNTCQTTYYRASQSYYPYNYYYQYQPYDYYQYQPYNYYQYQPYDYYQYQTYNYYQYQPYSYYGGYYYY